MLALFFLFYFLLIGLMIAGMWKTFDKAGEPGWAAIVPIYNVVVMAKVAQKEAIWVLIAIFFGIVGIPVLCIGIAERFGKSAIFGIGMAFLPFIFWPMLGFGDAQDEDSRRGRRRSRGRDYSDYEDDEDDRPRKKRRRDDDDEEEDERPSKRRQVVDEAEDDRPAKRRRNDDDDDDRPSKRRRNDDDDDDRPRRRRRDDD